MKIYYVIGVSIISLSFISNIIFNRILFKNNNSNYYGSKNKKKIIKKFNKKIDKQEKKELKIMKKRQIKSNSNLIKINKIKNNEVSELIVNSYNKNMLKDNDVITLDIKNTKTYIMPIKNNYYEKDKRKRKVIF